MGNLSFPHGGNIYAAKRIFKKDVIDFSANINPLGLPERIKKIIYKNFESILHYPDPQANITRKIAQYWGIKEENVLLGNGSIELIYLIVSCFMPKTTLIPVPTFSEYERAARNIKSRIKFVELYEKEDFRLKPSRLSDSDILFLCNPNNPTGNLIFTDSRMVEKLPHKLIAIDEVFMDFLPDEKKYTLIWKASQSKRIIVLRTFTKFFALPGLRIGYLVAHKDMVKTLKKYQMPWNVNALALKAAECMLADKSYINKTKQFIKKERNFLLKAIAEIDGLKPYPSVTNFLLLKVEEPAIDAVYLSRELLAKGILIRNCSNFRNLTNRFFRVAVRKRSENTQLIRHLREIFQNEKG